MALVKEYFELTAKYEDLYGKKTFLLMQVGAFFEVYGKREKGIRASACNGKFIGSEINEFTRICDFNIAEKHVTLDGCEVVMAGFKDIMLEKHLKKILDTGFTAVVYTQDEQNKTERSLAGVFSPGTYFSNDSTSSLTNNTTCIWIETFESKSRLNVLREKDQIVLVGIANIDVYTGKTTMFQFQETYTKSPTTYDELERFVSITCPSEIVFISNLPLTEMDSILQYIGVEAKLTHKICIHDTEETQQQNNSKLSLVKNCEKQTYQKEIIMRFYPNMEFEIFQQDFMYENHMATQAFCYLLDFVYQHNPHLVNKISEPVLENCSDRLVLANHSLKQLNILDDGAATTSESSRFSSVLKMLNLCTTAMGKRKFAHDLLNPTIRIQTLQREYDITEHMLTTYKHNDGAGTFHRLKEIRDLSKFKRQIVMKKISPQHLYVLYNNLKTVNEMVTFFSLDTALQTYFAEVGQSSFASLAKSCETICAFLDERLLWDQCKELDDIRDVERNFLLRGTNPELDKVNETMLEARDKLDAILEYLNKQIGNTEKKFKDGYVKYHETEKSSISLVATKRRALILKEQLKKNSKHGSSTLLEFTSSYTGTKNTFEFKCSAEELEVTNQSATNSFVSCPMIDKLSKDIMQSKTELKSMLIVAFYQIISQMDSQFQTPLEDISKFVTTIDVLHCKMMIAKKYNYCKPEIDDSPGQKSFFEAEDLRHCIIERIQQSELYVANSVTLGKGTRDITGTNKEADPNCRRGRAGEPLFSTDGILLYGTNAVGKTSFIRSVGIAVILAQAGLYVPARVFKFKPYKYIFTRILGNDNLFKGLSTFAVEMYELRTILRLANEDSLVLGDELCSGTESTSAISIFVAGIESLQKRGSSFLFATHLHEITKYEEITDLPTVKQMHMSVLYDKESDALIYDRKLRDGPGTSSYGLEVCKSLQLPTVFLDRAHEIRMKYRPEQANILSLNTSHYNSKKVMGLCEKCKIAMGEEVHHLQPQREANEEGVIYNADGLMFHKNHIANLMTLCEKCHNGIHNAIHNEMVSSVGHKKTKTTKGSKLTKQ